MSRGTLDTALLLLISDTRLSRFPAGLPRPFSYQSQINYAVLTPKDKSLGLGSFPFARHYLRNRISFFSSGYLDVSVPRVPSVKLCIGLTVLKVLLSGFPHSDIHGSKDICSSPWLFAAYHVLHRLSVPRHPPCALYSLTINQYIALY